MAAGIPSGQNRGASRLDHKDPQVRQVPAQFLAGAGDGAARSCRSYESVQPPTGVLQDLPRRPEAVRLRVMRVLELLRHEGIRQAGRQLLSLATAPVIPWSSGVSTISAP